MDIVLASNNKGKVAEFNDFFADTDIHFLPQSHFKLPSVPETGETFVENAIIKARYAAQHTSMPALADDSGLEIDALNGAPGVISAHYAGEHGNDTANIAKVLTELANTPDEQRTARFHCVLAFMKSPHDQDPLICQGIWEGQIIREARGDLGFGYDPIFWVPAHQCTAADLDPVLKNSISHRARAIAQLFKSLPAHSLETL